MGLSNLSMLHVRCVLTIIAWNAIPSLYYRYLHLYICILCDVCMLHVLVLVLVLVHIQFACTLYINWNYMCIIIIKFNDTNSFNTQHIYYTL